MPGKMVQCSSCLKMMRSDNLRRHLQSCNGDLQDKQTWNVAGSKRSFSEDSENTKEISKPKIQALANEIIGQSRIGHQQRPIQGKIPTFDGNEFDGSGKPKSKETMDKLKRHLGYDDTSIAIAGQKRPAALGPVIKNPKIQVLANEIINDSSRISNTKRLQSVPAPPPPPRDVVADVFREEEEEEEEDEPASTNILPPPPAAAVIDIFQEEPRTKADIIGYSDDSEESGGNDDKDDTEGSGDDDDDEESDGDDDTDVDLIASSLGKNKKDDEERGVIEVVVNDIMEPAVDELCEILCEITKQGIGEDEVLELERLLAGEEYIDGEPVLPKILKAIDALETDSVIPKSKIQRIRMLVNELERNKYRIRSIFARLTNATDKENEQDIIKQLTSEKLLSNEQFNLLMSRSGEQLLTPAIIATAIKDTKVD